MEWVKGLCLFGLSFGIVFCAACFANAEAVSFATNPLWVSSSHVTEGKAVQISTVVMKTDAESASGSVTFFVDGASIGTADFALSESVGGAVVGVSFVSTPGSHSISAKISAVKVVRDGKEETIPESAMIAAPQKLVVDADNDRDGVSDADDADDDNDTISDSDEKKNGTDPLKKEEAMQSVAGAATTSVSGIVEQAKEIAGPVGESVFETTEGWREKGKEYFDEKVAGASNTKGFASTTNKDLVANPKEGVIGIWEMVQAYFFKAGAVVFGNVYAFYILFILLILWILRKIWKRYSLD